jgi:hypothetical protein
VSPTVSVPSSGSSGAVQQLRVAGCGDDHLEQGGLAGPVRPDDPDDPARRQGERQVLVQQLVAEALQHPSASTTFAPSRGPSGIMISAW